MLPRRIKCIGRYYSGSDLYVYRISCKEVIDPLLEQNKRDFFVMILRAYHYHIQNPEYISNTGQTSVNMYSTPR